MSNKDLEPCLLRPIGAIRDHWRGGGVEAWRGGGYYGPPLGTVGA